MKNIITLILAVVTLGGAHAATVNWGADANFDLVLHDSSGALLSDNSLVRIGFFSLSDAAIQGLASPTPANLATLGASFTVFDSAQVGDGFGNDPGAFTKNSIVPIGGLANQQIYYWVLNGTSVATSNQQAIFYRNKVTDLDWAFPANDISATTVDAGDLRGLGGTISSGSVVLAGSYLTNSIPGAIYNGGPTSAIQLQGLAAPVPEPSAFVFGLLAGVGALCRRHRRAKV